MDVVEILLLCFVGFSVLVVLVLDLLEESEKNRNRSEKSSDFYDSESETRTGSSSSVELLKESDHQEEEEEKRSVGADFETAGFQEIAEEEEGEIENPVTVSCEKYCFCRGVSSISGDNCRNRRIIDDGEVEKEEFIDDWEGVERTELDKIFGEAVVFVNSNNNADRIGDLKLELYGLQKVALEGPCYQSQPMALKVSARSKWNAWQKLGNMSREMAMEKYVDILSKAIPGWKVDNSFTSSNPTVEAER